MKNLKVVVYFLFSVFLITSCSNSASEELEVNDKIEIAKQQAMVYDYFVDEDSLVVYKDSHTLKAALPPDIPKPGNGGGDDRPENNCWCVTEPFVYDWEETVIIGVQKKITFSGASRITYRGVGGGLNFAVDSKGVGTLICYKEGVYTGFEITTWRKLSGACASVYCQEAVFKYKVTCTNRER